MIQSRRQRPWLIQVLVVVTVVTVVTGIVPVVVGGCGIAPVIHTPTPPPVIRYIDPHGRPRAFGGGVCPFRGPHTHVYPPVPRASFVLDGGSWRDTRSIVTFPGRHPWRGGTCPIEQVHHHAATDGDLP